MPANPKPYLLLVDDTAANLRLLGPLLRAEGWSVAATTRGDEALELIAKRQPDLVLLDIMMPEMDGFEVCRRLRAQPETRDLPILFITALTDEENIVRGFREGGHDYITKPFRQAELIARVRTHLALRAATRKAEKQAADLARLNADKDRFFSIIAHDLRSPLSGLQGLCEELAAHLPEFSQAEIAEATTEMAKSARNVYQLLENLLEWAQLQTGRMECRPEQLDLMAMLGELAELFAQSAHQKQIQLQLQCQPVSAWADRRMTLAVLRNLFSNAIKFSPVGAKVLLRSRMENSRAMVEIADSGKGLTAEQVQALLQRNSKPMSQRGTAGERGTGLGLVLCQELLDRIGGSLSVSSTPGNGSVFMISLPARAGAP